MMGVEVKPLLEKLTMPEGFIIYIALCHFRDKLEELTKNKTTREVGEKEIAKVDKIIRKIPYNCK